MQLIHLKPNSLEIADFPMANWEGQKPFTNPKQSGRIFDAKLDASDVVDMKELNMQ